MSAQPLDIRMAHLEGAYDQVSQRLNGIELRLGRLDAKIDSKVDGLRDSLTAKIDGLQWRATALIVGTWITTMLAILFHRA